MDLPRLFCLFFMPYWSVISVASESQRNLPYRCIRLWADVSVQIFTL